MNRKSLLFCFMPAVFSALLFSLTLQAQTVVGTVHDEKAEALVGASVVVAGKGALGTVTDAGGRFTLSGLSAGSAKLIVSFIGYKSKEVAVTVSDTETNIGDVVLEVDASVLGEVFVMGVADFAKDRETPVAVSTIRASEIQTKLGNQEFPEVLRSTPSIYTTKQGGGFGDARINVRGFDQVNTAVMINGMPVNDMENGSVYWSNWAGLSDVTSALQVQRGLGSSKLAIASVGGTINVITKAADMKAGGTASVGVGNDGYTKFNLAYNTGLLKSGWAVSALISRTAGDNYVDGTKFEGYNYFLGIGYKPNTKNDFQFMITGAPQWHHQRSSWISLANYIKYGKDGEPDIRYNSDWGYKNGKEYNMTRNYYHKPVASINWEHVFNSRLSLSSVVYASWGRGGGTGTIGGINGTAYGNLARTEDGLVQWDKIMDWNSGRSVPEFGADRVAGTDGKFINNTSSRSGLSRRASVNSHDWYGLISNLSTKLADELTLNTGIDLRLYKGIHYRVLNDYLGADGFLDNLDKNNPNRLITELYTPSAKFNPFANIKDQQKIAYYNDGLVNWAGLHAQLEYSKNGFSAFLQGSLSNQAFKRIDYFNYLDSSPEQKTDWEKMWGGAVKAGINKTFGEHHNVFVNAGFLSRQPKFDAVFLNNVNELNKHLTNESITGFEAGYGFRSSLFDANVNLYSTNWKDQFLRRTITLPNSDLGVANITGVTQLHQGIEVDASLKLVNNKLVIKGMFSSGNWRYKGDVTTTYLNSVTNVPLDTVSQLYLDGVKVGDAAQLTSSLDATYEVIKGLKVNVGWYHADNLYALISPANFTASNNKGSLKLPSYDLFDAGLYYKLAFKGNNSLGFALNVNNLFDTVYISESKTNNFTTESSTNWKGINTSNMVWFGFGRTWNLTVKYSF